MNLVPAYDCDNPSLPYLVIGNNSWGPSDSSSWWDRPQVWNLRGHLNQDWLDFCSRLSFSLTVGLLTNFLSSSFLQVSQTSSHEFSINIYLFCWAIIACPLYPFYAAEMGSKDEGKTRDEHTQIPSPRSRCMNARNSMGKAFIFSHLTIEGGTQNLKSKVKLEIFNWFLLLRPYKPRTAVRVKLATN